MPGRGPMMWRTAECCGGGDAEVTQVAIDDRGFTLDEPTTGLLATKDLLRDLAQLRERQCPGP